MQSSNSLTLFQCKLLAKVCGLILCLFTLQSVAAQGQPWGDFRSPPQFAISNGVLIVDGSFEPPPYRISRGRDGATRINNLSIQQPSKSSAESGVGSSNPVRESTQSSAMRISSTLQSNGIVIVDSNFQLQEVHNDIESIEILNKLLADDKSRISQLSPILQALAPRLLDNPDFVAYIRSITTLVNDAQRQNEAISSRVRLLDTLAYPLTTLGMLMVVFATGQLLINRPPQSYEASQTLVQNKKSTLLFAALIVAFSLLDLVWTYVASHDGAMRELNPIGSHLIANPQLLVVFKMATTGVAASILIYFREVRLAQTATWWMCLLLTLLTARWSVFNSLLV